MQKCLLGYISNTDAHKVYPWSMLTQKRPYVELSCATCQKHLKKEGSSNATRTINCCKLKDKAILYNFQKLQSISLFLSLNSTITKKQTKTTTTTTKEPVKHQHSKQQQPAITTAQQNRHFITKSLDACQNFTRNIRFLQKNTHECIEFLKVG